MGSRAIIYYFATTMLAAVLGIVLVLVIHPGDPAIKAQTGKGESDCSIISFPAPDTFLLMSLL
jgi:solute carrier family 1 (high affinity glutamate transporter) protein 2